MLPLGTLLLAAAAFPLPSQRGRGDEKRSGERALEREGDGDRARARSGDEADGVRDSRFLKGDAGRDSMAASRVEVDQRATRRLPMKYRKEGDVSLCCIEGKARGSRAPLENFEALLCERRARSTHASGSVVKAKGGKQE